MPDVCIQHASNSNIPEIKRIADANKNALGFLTSGKIKDAITRQNLLVIFYGDRFAGFVIYRHRIRDRQTTLYDICVDSTLRNLGLGRALINALVQECRELERFFILLKCPVGLNSNSFYQHLGFQQVRVESGKTRTLNVWKLTLLEAE